MGTPWGLHGDSVVPYRTTQVRGQEIGANE
jgi:hypothetical protein